MIHVDPPPSFHVSPFHVSPPGLVGARNRIAAPEVLARLRIPSVDETARAESSGIEGQPVTWEQDGVQYVAVTSGYGGVYSLFSGDERLAQVPAGGSLWVFAVKPR